MTGVFSLLFVYSCVKTEKNSPDSSDTFRCIVMCFFAFLSQAPPCTPPKPLQGNIDVSMTLTKLAFSVCLSSFSSFFFLAVVATYLHLLEFGTATASLQESQPTPPRATQNSPAHILRRYAEKAPPSNTGRMIGNLLHDHHHQHHHLPPNRHGEEQNGIAEKSDTFGISRCHVDGARAEKPISYKD